MRFLVLAIVMAFPLADLYLTAHIARWTGIPLWLFLTGSFAGGLLLLRNERIAFRMNTVAALHGEQALMRGLLDSGRKVLAGFLLIIPGLVTDAIALLLLMLPLNVGRRFEPQPAGAAPWPQGPEFDTLDGDYRRSE